MRPTTIEISIALSFALLSYVPDAASARPCTAADKTTKTFTAGGGGGDAWNDGKTVDEGQISQIEIWSGEYVDAIRVSYGSVFGTKHGGDGGALHILKFQPGEKITLVSGRSGDVVDQLCFATNLNTTPACYGGGGGAPFQFQAPGSSLKSILGRAGRYADQLVFNFGPPTGFDPASVTYDAKQLLNEVLQAPDASAKQTIRNDTAVAQQVTFSKTYQEADVRTKEWRFDATNAWEVGVDFSIGKKDVASASLSFKYTRTETSSNGGSSQQQQQNTNAWEIPVKIPPHTQVTAISTWKDVSLRLPVSYDIVYYSEEGNNQVELCREHDSTTLEGAVSSEVTHQFEQTPLGPSQ